MTTAPASVTRPPSTWRSSLGTIGAVVLGAVLLFAAYAKIIDPVRFEEAISLEGLDFLFAARWVALLAIALEVFLGVALLLGVRHKWIVIPSILLVAFFIYLTAHSWYAVESGLRSADESCGCFGNLVERTPKEAFFMDLLLLVPPLLLLIWGMQRGALPRVRVGIAAALAVALTAVTFFAPSLPFDDLATKLHVGEKITNSCAGEGDDKSCLNTVQVGLERGHWVVVLADLKDDTFVNEHFAALNEYSRATRGSSLPKLILMTPSKEDRVKFISNSGAAAFSVWHAPGALLRPLYRRLPRTFRVKDDEIIEVWDGLPSFKNAGADNEDWGNASVNGGGNDYGEPGDADPGESDAPEYGDDDDDAGANKGKGSGSGDSPVPEYE